MGKQLVIAEKPSVAKAVASALGGAAAQKGYMESDDYIFSWCFGHLLDEAPPGAYDPRYEKWNVADLPILPGRWMYTLRKNGEDQYRTLEHLISQEDVDAVINACDAGREGELIFRNVYRRTGTKKPMLRLWISSMEECAIREGMANLKPGSDYDNLFEAAQCRSRADWTVGINATRLFTCQYGPLLNVGRVVTPTLAILCERQDKIDSFRPEPYWHVRLDLKGAQAVSEKMETLAEAKALLDAVQKSSVTITSVEQKEKKENPPMLFDLTALQREANRLFGYTAQKTLDILQNLYEKKLMTYPRTDSRFLPDDMEDAARQTLDMVRGMYKYTGRGGSGSRIRRILNSKKVSDHHAIIPTPEAGRTDRASLDPEERTILELVSARLAEASAEPHIYLQTKITATGDGRPFTIRGRETISEGWRAIRTAAMASLRARPDEDDEKKDEDESQNLPVFTEGEVFDHPAGKVTEHLTKAPAAYTEAALLSAMEHAGEKEVTEEIERAGLGTPATRAGVIEKLVKGGLAVRKKKSLVPSKAGRMLISVLPGKLTSASMTADWENRLSRVASGTENGFAFLKDIYRFTKEFVSENSLPVPAEKKAAFQSGLQGKKGRTVIGICPKCGGEVVRNTKGWACANKDCPFAMWQAEKFFEWKKVKFTEKMAKDLLKNGRTLVKGMYSAKKDKTYDAYVTLEDCSGKYVKYGLDFGTPKKK